jgi:hypothetical protein
MLNSVETWIHEIQNVVKAERERVREDKYPLAEINYWRDRSTGLGAIYEQLQVPVIQKAIKVNNFVHFSRH